MLRIAICDDDQTILKELPSMIHYVLGESALISVHDNPFSLMTWIVDEAKGALDLLIMDIRLSEEDGIEVAKMVLDLFPEIKIVFMSGYIYRVQDVFQLSPVYFLLKPIDMKYLRNALQKTIEQINEAASEVLAIKASGGRRQLMTFKIRDLYYIESSMHVLYIHEESGIRSVYMKLSELEQGLPENFCRCHQSYIVNIDKVQKVTQEKILLFSGQEIPVSRSRRSATIEKISKYLKIGADAVIEV